MLRKIRIQDYEKIDGKALEREIYPGQPLGIFRCSGRAKSFKNEEGLGKNEAGCLDTSLKKK